METPQVSASNPPLLILQSAAQVEQLRQGDATRFAFSAHQTVGLDSLEKIVNMVVTNDVPLEDIVQSVSWLENLGGKNLSTGQVVYKADEEDEETR
ncbi:unnamed protein product [Echinostoma caproni]|uniref:DNA-directed RNA polymerase III subunit RPC9 n=1 Tax=Echinostoma caproni TaxID=27848 RepID=A0A183B8K3_9TREM|nr:unnamed protein product [Echinostoma caproni]